MKWAFKFNARENNCLKSGNGCLIKGQIGIVIYFKATLFSKKKAVESLLYTGRQFHYIFSPHAIIHLQCPDFIRPTKTIL